MEWKQRHTLKLPPTGSVYEFIGGLYGNGREDDSRVELPLSDTPMDPPNLKTWTHPMGDVNIIDFTMDPSQDLLVLVALAPPEYVPSTDFTFSHLLEQKQIKVCLGTTYSFNHNESATPQISLVRASTPRQTLGIPSTVRSNCSCSCAGGRRSRCPADQRSPGQRWRPSRDIELGTQSAILGELLTYHRQQIECVLELHGVIKWPLFH